MTTRVEPAASPPLRLVLPFFLVGPAFLAGAGVAIALGSAEAFDAFNAPRTVAAVHLAVLGWATTMIFGALYQLGAAVLHVQALSQRLAYLHLPLHLSGVLLLVAGAWNWDTKLFIVGGPVTSASLILGVVNIGWPLLRARPAVTRSYALAAFAFLGVTLALGLIWVWSLRFGGPAITPGRISAHAHVGLVGWLALMIMGVSHQLVPMFNVVHGARARFASYALLITVLGILLAATTFWQEPPAALRFAVAVVLATGPFLWAVDIVRLLRMRARRKLDIQGRSTIAGLVWLAVTMVLGIGVATGSTAPGDSPAGLIVAYGAAGLLGWVGSTLIGNSFKIVAFLVWFHRYRPKVGKEPVPVLTDIYSERAAVVILAGQAAAAALVVAAGLAGSPGLLAAGGWSVAIAGGAHTLALWHMLLPKHSSRPVTPVMRANAR